MVVMKSIMRDFAYGNVEMGKWHITLIHGLESKCLVPEL